MKIIPNFMYTILHQYTNDIKPLAKNTTHFNSIIIKFNQQKPKNATSISVRNCCPELRDIKVK